MNRIVTAALVTIAALFALSSPASAVRVESARVTQSTVIDLTRPCAAPDNLNCTWYGYPAGGVDPMWTNVRYPNGRYCQTYRVGSLAGTTRCEWYWPFTAAAKAPSRLAGHLDVVRVGVKYHR